MNISNIFRDHRVQAKIPQYFKYLDPPIICYKYNKPIRNLIFNYNKVTSDENIKESCPVSCKCANSKFLYEPAGHIVTGDLSIIKHKYIRNLLGKGPKYRIPSKIDFEKCRKVFYDSLKEYAKKWCKTEGVKDHALQDWMNLILDIVDLRIDNYNKNPHLLSTTSSNSVNRLKSILNSLHKEFVFVPADKASNNTIII